MVNLTFGIILELITLLLALCVLSWIVYLLKTTKNSFYKISSYFLLAIIMFIIVLASNIIGEMNNQGLELVQGIGYFLFVIFISIGIYKLKSSVSIIVNGKIKIKKKLR